MTDNEYTANFNRIMTLVLVMLNEEEVIREMLTIALHAEVVGPFLDPTAWIHRRGAKNIAEQLTVLRALLAAIREIKQIESLREALAMEAAR